MEWRKATVVQVARDYPRIARIQYRKVVLLVDLVDQSTCQRSEFVGIATQVLLAAAVGPKARPIKHRKLPCALCMHVLRNLHAKRCLALHISGAETKAPRRGLVLWACGLTGVALLVEVLDPKVSMLEERRG